MNKIVCGDCLQVTAGMPGQSVDLVFGSPPYEDARTYGIDFKLKGQDWVDWMVEVYKESLRVCQGLVAFVVAGRTRKFAWSCTPALLIADLHRAGIAVRNSPLYVRDGIPGSGGPDWLKSKYEFIVCATNGGRLPWSDNTVMGHPPKCGPGGPLSRRKANGARVNSEPVYARNRRPDGTMEKRAYKPPKIANPGNIIDCRPGGGGHLGSKLAHENEAPFPEKLAEFFVRSFCPPGGTVLDPFGGSGTTMASAEKHGRDSISIDIRDSQVELMHRRIGEVKGIKPMPAFMKRR